MKRKYNVLLKLILMVLIASFLLTSCQKGSIGNGDNKDSSHGPLWIEGGEGVTLTYWIPMDYVCSEEYSSLSEHPFFKWMEDQTGVKVEFVHPSEEQMDVQFNMMLNSGNFCDLMFNPNYYDGSQAAVEDGIFADLNEFRKIMPNYFKALSCNDGSFSAWEWGKEKDLYNEYFPKGAASIFTFEVKGTAEDAKKFTESLKLFSLLANVADVKSLVIHPASTTHSQLDEKELLASGITPTTVRLSIGTEHIDDIIADLENGFEAIKH